MFLCMFWGCTGRVASSAPSLPSCVELAAWLLCDARAAWTECLVRAAVPLILSSAHPRAAYEG